MIVRYESDGSIVMITQNDHAQLSGLFVAHFAPPAETGSPRPAEKRLRSVSSGQFGT